jgi:hypothetical protein
MKPIKSSKPGIPIYVKVSGFIVFFIVVVSALLSVKFAESEKATDPVLTTDADLQSPVASQKSGFYPSPVVVDLSSDPGSEIYYTLDGSEPSMKSMLYKGSVLITGNVDDPLNLALIPTSTRWKPPLNDIYKGSVLRAISVSHDNKKSRELIQTFFINDSSKRRYSLPVIAITVNPDDLFGYSKGIYIMGKRYEDKDYYIKKNLSLNMPWWDYPSNYRKRGENSGRYAHVELFDTTGHVMEMNSVIRINGNATRGFSQKSIRVSLHEDYNNKTQGIKIFADSNITRVNSFVLRNSGNDWDKTMFRDAFMQSLMKGSELDLQDCSFVIVFINGEYWGIHDLRQRLDNNYLSNKYSLGKDSLVILEFEGRLVYGKKKDEKEFADFLKMVNKADLSNNDVYRLIQRQIDIQSFMDFIIANVYFCNGDWPNNNVKFWRFRNNKGSDSLGVRDGRWRWMLFDTDWGFGYSGSNAYEMNLLEKATRTGSVGVLFRALLKNREFVESFNERFQYHLNTRFKTERVLTAIDNFQHLLAPEMQEHIDRWRAIGSYEKWMANVDDLREFARKRPAIQKKQLAKFVSGQQK